MTRGEVWARAIFPDGRSVASIARSVLVVDGSLEGQPWRAIAIVPNPAGAFARARSGEAGLDEGLGLAAAVRDAPSERAILALVDVPGQAFGRREESAGLQLALAAAVEAYAMRRRAGGPVFSLVVGRAISGAFLAHGMQAGWLGALRDPGIEVHVMSAAAVSRVTRASAEEGARVSALVPATARDIETFARFGAIDELFDVRDPLAPEADELAAVRTALAVAFAAGEGLRAPAARLADARAATMRAPALAVRAAMRAAWNE